ncbi:MAG: hypothetical protein V1887_00880 [Candidatus Aenigmatarchaeota archaeon]
MQVSIVEEEKEKLKIEVKGESPTLTQLIATQIWKENGQAAAFREHPFMVEPKILVEGNNPRKLLEKAAKAVEEQADQLKDELKRALKESPATKELARPTGITGTDEFEKA